MDDTHLHTCFDSPARQQVHALTSDVIQDIARRALWNPARVGASEVQAIAASVLQHVHGEDVAVDGAAGGSGGAIVPP